MYNIAFIWRWNNIQFVLAQVPPAKGGFSCDFIFCKVGSTQSTIQEGIILSDKRTQQIDQY